LRLPAEQLGYALSPHRRLDHRAAASGVSRYAIGPDLKRREAAFWGE